MANKFSGIIIKKTGDKTINVRVDRVITAPKYNKQITKSKKYLVHDPENIYQVGEKVSFISSKPISKNKKFIVIGK